MQVILAVGPRIQERRALRRAQPLVAVAGIPVRAKSTHVERHLRRPVRAIDQHGDAGRMTRLDNILQRQHQRAARGDVIDHGEPCAWRHRCCDVGDDCIGRGMREWHLGFHHAGAGAFTQVANRIAYCAIAMAQHHDFIIRSEMQRTQHRVATGRRVLDKRDVLAVGADEGGQPVCRMT
jgi:hypothetical protein